MIHLLNKYVLKPIVCQALGTHQETKERKIPIPHEAMMRVALKSQAGKSGLELGVGEEGMGGSV